MNSSSHLSFTSLRFTPSSGVLVRTQLLISFDYLPCLFYYVNFEPTMSAFHCWRNHVMSLTSPAARRAGFIICVGSSRCGGYWLSLRSWWTIKHGKKGNGSSVTGREMDNSKRTVVVTGLSSLFPAIAAVCCRQAGAAGWSGGKVVEMTAAPALMASGCYCFTPRLVSETSWLEL